MEVHILIPNDCLMSLKKSALVNDPERNKRFVFPVRTSVVIATKNREEALRSISLPSLVEQGSSNFEIIIWDAGDLCRSRLIVASFSEKFAEKGIPLFHVPAPRHGLVSQRNDAVRTIEGEFVFFIDDDSSLSSDGVQSVAECFDANPMVMGVGLVVEDLLDGKKPHKNSFSKIKELLYRAFAYRRKRVVSLSGSAKGITAPAGSAEWLSGCSMAFRKSVFNNMFFNEKLETFGPYAMFEDIEFSHRVFRHYGTPLLVASNGSVSHHSVSGSRIVGAEKKAAMYLYNRYLSMRITSADHYLMGRFSFAWALARSFLKLSRECGTFATIRGFLMAAKKIGEKNNTLKDKGIGQTQS